MAGIVNEHKNAIHQVASIDLRPTHQLNGTDGQDRARQQRELANKWQSADGRQPRLDRGSKAAQSVSDRCRCQSDLQIHDGGRTSPSIVVRSDDRARPSRLVESNRNWRVKNRFSRFRHC